MCSISGKLEIYIDQANGYMKGRAGKSWYIPPSGSVRLKQAVRELKGQTISGETVRGMLVQIKRG